AGGLADERVALELGREVVAPVDGGAAGRGARREPAVLAQLVLLVAAVDAGIHARGPRRLVLHDLDADPRALAGVRAPGVTGHEIAAEIVAVRVVEEAPEVVLRDAPLAARARRADAEAAVLVAEAHDGVRAVDPVVHHRQQPVARVLDGGPVAERRGDQDLLVALQ